MFKDQQNVFLKMSPLYYYYYLFLSKADDNELHNLKFNFSN